MGHVAPSRRRICGIATAALVVAHGLAAGAAPIMVGFSGTITSVTDPGGLLDPAVAVNAPFSGHYTIDPDDVSSSMPVSPSGAFHELSPTGSITVSIAGVPYSTPITGVGIGDDFVVPGEGSRDFWGTARPVTVPTAVDVSANFLDSTATRLSGEDFFVNQTLTGWDLSVLQLSRLIFGPAGEPEVETLAIGTITSLAVVPEPGTALLVAGGLCGLAALRRKRATAA